MNIGGTMKNIFGFVSAVLAATILVGCGADGEKTNVGQTSLSEESTYV